MGFYGSLLDFMGFNWDLMAFNWEFMGVNCEFMWFNWDFWVFMVFYGFNWDSMGVWVYGILLGAYGFLLEFMECYDYSLLITGKSLMYSRLFIGISSTRNADRSGYTDKPSSTFLEIAMVKMAHLVRFGTMYIIAMVYFLRNRYGIYWYTSDFYRSVELPEGIKNCFQGIPHISYRHWKPNQRIILILK